MKKIALAIACLFTVICGITQSKPLTGFNENSAKQQIQLEQRFDALLSAPRIDTLVRQLSARPHHVGSPGGKIVADLISQKFRDWGFAVQTETFYVLFPTPKTRLLEMTGPTTYKAVLNEPALKEDATSNQQAEQLPTYNCWSADGDVTGELVFVNYGLQDDYEKLARLGIDVKGRIVIAKYGASWRGIKPKIAQEHGAIGCIIYSDPKEDGYYQGDVYPKGAYKNEYGVQRGSVLDMPVYPGDPLTPNIGATKDAKRILQSEALNLLKIPVLPISYHDALPLLRSLEGPVAPDEWRGALPITYHIGPGKTTVHLKLAFSWDIKPLNNIIATLPGTDYPDEWVIRGNHHDAWVNGADDPISSQAIMMEEARAVGELVKNGWKPKRTLVYCAWDGEEPGLLGSTEWVEFHGDELQQKAVAYINTDGNGRGFLYAEGSHALEPFVNEVARDVTDPETGISTLDRRRASDIINSGTNVKNKKELLDSKTIKIGALGSGSDFSPFLQHIGVPSLNLAFGGEDEGGEYHSIYDSYDDYRRFKDPGFVYGVALAKLTGRASLRLLQADALPFDFRTLYKTIDGYVQELITGLSEMRDNTVLENDLVRQKQYDYATDPTRHESAPKLKDEVPFIDFSPLQNAMQLLDKTTNALSIALQGNFSIVKQDEINKTLFQAEQKLLSPTGLPGRPWYRHAIYAPGFYTGYGVKTLPGIREAIEQRDWKLAQQQIETDAAVIGNFDSYLAALLQKTK